MVSFVIPTYNRDHLLKDVIYSLIYQMNDLDYEILVIDSSTTGSTNALVEDFCDDRIRYFNILENSPSAKRNFGLHRANFDWVAFLDDDCVPDQNYLSTLNNTLALNDSAMNVFCGYIQYPSKWIMASNYFRFRNEAHYNLKKPPKNIEFQHITTMNMLINKNCVSKYNNYFDENYTFHCEDIDFGLRLLLNGFKIKFSEFSVTHFETSGNLINYCGKLSRMRTDGMPQFIEKFPNYYKNIYWSKFTLPKNRPFFRKIFLNMIFPKFLVNFSAMLLIRTDKIKFFYIPLLFHYVLIGSYIGKLDRNT